MTVVAASPMTFSHSDNDLALQLGLLGEQLDTHLSQELAGLPSIDFASMLSSDMLASNVVKLEDNKVSQAAEPDTQDGESDAECSDSDLESDNSDDDTAAAPQQPATPHDSKPDGSSPLVAVPASSNMCSLTLSSAGMPLRGMSPSLRVSHPSLPQTSQGFVPLSDINTASGQGRSHSISSSPSSAFGGTSSNPFDHANASSVLPEQQKGKRKADQMELDTILDPAEKKKQRRLAKNRATAALSRERKKAQLQVLQHRVRTLEQENSSLAQALTMRDAEIKRLKDRAAGQPKGSEVDAEPTFSAATEVAKDPGPRIVYPSVSALPRIYRSIANPPSSSFPHQPRVAHTGQLPVGATTHFPQRSVFSAPILEHRPLRSDSSLPHSEPLQRQQQPTQSAMVQSQSVTHAQSAQPARSQSINPSQSAQQTSPVEPVLESPTQQEASSQQATSQTQPAVAAAAGGFQSDPTVSMQPSIQTPFNVVTSGESGQTAKQRQSNNSSAPACAGAGADRHCMGPPAVDGFTPHVSPFVAHSERSLHIQHAPHHPAPPAGEGPPHKKYNQGASSRSGSYNYGSNHNPAAAYPAQDLGNCYPPTYMQSHLSSQGSAGFNAMSQSASQCQFQQQQQQQQQQVPQSMPSWQGCEVRASPRHPGGSWNWSDGIGQTMGPNQMDGCCLNHSGSNNWDSQQAQSSQFSMPSQPDWSEQQPWRQQQTDVSAAWAGPMRPPWPPQAIAVTPQGSAFGHTVGPLTEPHRLPGELEPPACRWMASANSALAEMFPVMPSMPQMPTMDASLAWMGCDLNTEASQHGYPDF